eukprot:scaffold102537_cov54-Phaeocystis_antarctica.AAC.1
MSGARTSGGPLGGAGSSWVAPDLTRSCARPEPAMSSLGSAGVRGARPCPSASYASSRTSWASSSRLCSRAAIAAACAASKCAHPAACASRARMSGVRPCASSAELEAPALSRSRTRSG